MIHPQLLPDYDKAQFWCVLFKLSMLHILSCSAGDILMKRPGVLVVFRKQMDQPLVTSYIQIDVLFKRQFPASLSQIHSMTYERT